MAGDIRLHRLIRRGTVYGPPLPEGVLEDDGLDRGIMFAFLGAHLGRQFEFVQTQWMSSATARGGGRQGPHRGAERCDGTFTIPRRPIRRRLQGCRAS